MKQWGWMAGNKTVLQMQQGAFELVPEYQELWAHLWTVPAHFVCDPAHGNDRVLLLGHSFSQRKVW